MGVTDGAFPPATVSPARGDSLDEPSICALGPNPGVAFVRVGRIGGCPAVYSGVHREASPAKRAPALTARTRARRRLRLVAVLLNVALFGAGLYFQAHPRDRHDLWSAGGVAAVAIVNSAALSVSHAGPRGRPLRRSPAADRALREHAAARHRGGHRGALGPARLAARGAARGGARRAPAADHHRAAPLPPRLGGWRSPTSSSSSRRRPGVYLFKGADGEVLYVGKARVLRDRVRSYFQASRPTELHKSRMVEEITDLDLVVTDSEMEALALENNLALALLARRPADARHVGDRIFARKERRGPRADVHHAVEPVHLVGVAVDRIWNLLRRVEAEMVRLPRHRPEPAHLPEQPLIDLDARTLVRRIELAGLAPEILQDRAGFEDRNRPAARAVADRRSPACGCWARSPGIPA